MSVFVRWSFKYFNTYVLPVPDAGEPAGFHGFALILRVFAVDALDFHDEAQGIIGAVAVVDEDDEVGDIDEVLGTAARRDFKAEALVFGVGNDLQIGLGDAAELSFSVAVQGDPVDVAFAGIGLPAAGFAGGEVDLDAGARGVVGIKEGFDGAFADE
jgi:hypothetical protein